MGGVKVQKGSVEAILDNSLSYIMELVTGDTNSNVECFEVDDIKEPKNDSDLFSGRLVAEKSIR
jgi:hypothetical protein